ncbi:MAG TPA: hypothetical protein DCK83_01000 [Gallionellaceae bacterium]|nr:hypothetical protein [Gallionellaceae bacterium]
MPDVSAIQFTQDQARALTGVSVETVRHWRKTVPYLSSKAGKSARFTIADLLGLAITHELVNSFGIHIATMSKGVDALFRLLAVSNPSSLDGAVVLITATEATLHEPGTAVMNQISTKPSLTIPLEPLMAKIQRYMLPNMPVSTQKVLPFPPEIVRSRA